jgi:hypothetical protein
VTIGQGQATGLAKGAGSTAETVLRRRAGTGLKPGCPWCGSTSSAVYESRGDRWQPVYRRRRQCVDCRRDWPTVEALDQVRFRRELRALGLKLDDLGLE